jgi:peptide chain release factor 1
MAENSLLSRLDGIESRFEEVSTLITDPAVIADMKRYVKLTKEYKDLEKLTKTTRAYRTLIDNIKEAAKYLIPKATTSCAPWQKRNSTKPMTKYRNLKKR